MTAGEVIFAWFVFVFIVFGYWHLQTCFHRARDDAFRRGFRLGEKSSRIDREFMGRFESEARAHDDAYTHPSIHHPKQGDKDD